MSKQEEYIRCYKDKTRIYFIENYLHTFDAMEGHEVPFKLFPRQKAYLEQEREELIAALPNNRYGGSRFTVKQIEAAIKKINKKIEDLAAKVKANKDAVIDFESLGIDRLYVDEAHLFKNMDIGTKMTNIAGIQANGSIKSMDMYIKTRYMDEIVPNKGIIFATGTPISNTMCELYTMQKYLQYNTLKKLNLLDFDSWAATFGEISTENELVPEGKGYQLKTRFSRFNNLPELMNIFKQCASIQMADTLDLDVPEFTYETITCEPNNFQKAMLEDIVERAQKVRNRQVLPKEDNMLKITNDGRALALDIRLMDETLPDEPDSKVNILVQNVFGIYKDTEANKSTQVIFCDLSTPKAKSKGFSIYNDIKDKLVNLGINSSEIAFIHDYETDKEKENLFKNVNAGSVRVILGSTSKLGAGTNMQKKLIALHHLDIPWKPSDIEQREGRIIRQGNENQHVKILPQSLYHVHVKKLMKLCYLQLKLKRLHVTIL